jgi:hypothetical protein
MKKRKFNTGGEFELSDEAKAAGLSMGRNPNIREADRAAAIAEVERNIANAESARTSSKGLSDSEAASLMGREVNTPRAAPRATPRVTPKPDMVSDQISRNVPAPRTAMQTPAPSRRNENDYSMNEQEGSGNINYGGGAAARAPSRGDYSRNGPIGDAVDAISGLMSRLPRAEAARRAKLRRERPLEAMPMKKGGAVKASKRADGIAQRGKTKGRMC